MKRFLIFNFLLLAVSFGQLNSWAHRFKEVINDPKGISISLKIEQKQFSDVSIESGVIEIVKKKHYILDFPSESVFVTGDTIQTWNKATNQLIIDQTIEGDMNIFDLLTGDFEYVTFGKITQRKKNIFMLFDVPIMGYGGELILKKNGEPDSVKVIYGPDQTVLLTVNDFKRGNLTYYYQFNPKNAEVIDLRE